jgi:hypothetical protein
VSLIFTSRHSATVDKGKSEVSGSIEIHQPTHHLLPSKPKPTSSVVDLQLPYNLNLQQNISIMVSSAAALLPGPIQPPPTSQFFKKAPIEVRNMIYQLVFTSSTGYIHFVSAGSNVKDPMYIASIGSVAE